MAENVIKSRIMLKYDTLGNWTSSTLVLKQGEMAIAEVPSNASSSGLTPPAIGIKVGDGTKTFSQLGWIQAVAGDVYAWAKAATKPTYDASEITGLSSYNTSYRITTGTGANANKYFLESQTAGSNTWTTVSTVDLNSITDRIGVLETWANPTESLIDQISDQAVYEISKLNVTDTTVSHQFVTGVSESKGKITVSRGSISTDDITSGSFPVARGGTGHTSFESGEVLVGNGSGAINTKPIDSSVTTDSTNLITSGGVKTYVDGVLSTFTGAMHFIGTAVNAIAPDSTTDPGISNYNFANARAGDVILQGQEEFVWTGTKWQLLGDEGSYAVKGSIRNSDIASNAAIDQSKISGLTTDLNNKVDKVNGKGLSTEDYTTAEQTKLAGIETGAEVNAIEVISVDGVAVTINTADRSVDLGALAGKDEVSELDLDSALRAKINGAPSSLADIAYDGDVGNLTQTTTYLVIDCGNASDKLYN